MNKMIDSMRLSDGLEAIASSTNRKLQKPTNTSLGQNRTQFAEFMSTHAEPKNMPQRTPRAYAEHVATPQKYNELTNTQVRKPNLTSSSRSKVEQETVQKDDKTLPRQQPKNNDNSIEKPIENSTTASQKAENNTQIEPKKIEETTSENPIIEQASMHIIETLVQPTDLLPQSPLIVAISAQPQNQNNDATALTNATFISPHEINEFSALQQPVLHQHMVAKIANEEHGIIPFKNEKSDTLMNDIYDNLQMAGQPTSENNTLPIQNVEPQSKQKSEAKVEHSSHKNELLETLAKFTDAPKIQPEIAANNERIIATHIDIKTEPSQNLETSPSQENSISAISSSSPNAAHMGNTHSGSGFQHNGKNDNFQNITDTQTSAPHAETTSTLDALPFHVKRMIDQAKDVLEIRLDPLDLGKIEIRLERGEDNKMTAHIIADVVQTRDLLQKDASALEKTLRANGMNLDSGGMQFSLRQDNQNNASDQKQTSKLTASAMPNISTAPLENTQNSAINTHSLAYNRIYRPGRMDLRI